MNKVFGFFKTHRLTLVATELFIVATTSFFLAMGVMGLWHWDLSVPMVYSGHDDIWQLVLTKVLKDTGWILNNPFLGAPDIAHWQYHAAAQTSAIHSFVMLGLSNFIDDAVKIQQVYYLLNFPLIAITSYLVCRLLGIARFTSISVAILFAFTTFRFKAMLLAFISNYFIVPLALLPIYWILTGEFRRYFSTGSPAASGIRELFRSRKFWVSVACVVLVTLSDGYYAFFTLLLLGFATGMRAVSGDIMKPASLFAPILLIATVILISFAMTQPLISYKSNHPEEFAPGGNPDPALVKHPMEAEVYSTSLKILVAPISDHQIEKIGHLGQHIMNTSDAARKFPIIKPNISLGAIGSTLLFGSLMILVVLVLRLAMPSNQKVALPVIFQNNAVLWASVILAVFILLSSISGGIGSLVALVYPTIRAYDRFPIFLIFVLFVGAASAITAILKNATKKKLSVAIFATFAMTLFGLYDQIPVYAAKGMGDAQKRFLSERDFVRQIEASLPTGAMIYQYPHSQYLSDSKYYGWGAFSHIRLYLHSKALRWSNGASKNSFVEVWHERIAGMPLEMLINEVAATGFRGFVIDRAVIPPEEYQQVRAALANQGLAVIEDEPSRLAFAKLRDPGFRIVYDRSFREATQLVISDPTRFRHSMMPRMINRTAVEKLLATKSYEGEFVIEHTVYPEAFFTLAHADRGMGSNPVLPLTDMQGDVRCVLESSPTTFKNGDTLVMKITNNSDFDWNLGQGKYPLRIGVHFFSLDGTLLEWDDGFRIPTNAYIPSNGSVKISFLLTGLGLNRYVEVPRQLVAEFGLVQDGHAWFNALSCKVIL
jgi:hypothetical protein